MLPTAAHSYLLTTHHHYHFATEMRKTFTKHANLVKARGIHVGIYRQARVNRRKEEITKRKAKKKN